MHQTIVAIDPRDVSPTTPFCDMPFTAWLLENEEPVFLTAVKKYLGIDKPPVGGCMTSEQITIMRHCHSQVWFLRKWGGCGYTRFKLAVYKDLTP